MSPPAQPLSIFDLDRTLTRYGTWSPFLLFAAKRRAPWRLMLAPVLLIFMAAYKLHLISRKRLKEIMHAVMLGRSMPSDELSALSEDFARHCMTSNIYAEALDLIRQEQNDGRMIMIASASPSFYLSPLAMRLEVDHAIGTGSVRRDGMTLSRIDGPNCYGESKLELIQAYLNKHGMDAVAGTVRFYSDDISDLPSFLWADEPIAVNPSAQLRRAALDRGWIILDWGRSASGTDQLIEEGEIGA